MEMLSLTLTTLLYPTSKSMMLARVEGIQRRLWLKNSLKPWEKEQMRGRAKKEEKRQLNGVTFGSVGERIGGGAVLDPVAPLEKQRAQPPVLPLVVLDVVFRRLRLNITHAYIHICARTLAAQSQETKR